MRRAFGVCSNWRCVGVLGLGPSSPVFVSFHAVLEAARLGVA